MTAPILTVSCLFCKQETSYLTVRPTNLYKYDLTGQRFGRLTVNHYVEQRATQSYWCCRCICGGVKCVDGKRLRKRHTQSCGCLWIQTITKHGMSHTTVYTRWENMKSRCLNPHDIAFPNYGGRGIQVCARWAHSFEAFLQDMGIPAQGMTLERKETDGSYNPENCIWASREAQQNNRRNNHRLTYQGQTHTLSEWARLYGYSYATLVARIKRNWSVERALTEPVHRRS